MTQSGSTEAVPVAVSEPLAHVADDGRVHALADHLDAVARLAAGFGEPLGCAGHARLAGLWHDLGKYSGDFQKLIRQENGLEAHIEGEGNERNHSYAGAIHALARDPRLVPVVAAIAGHHAGLSNREDLRERLDRARYLHEAVLRRQPPGEIVNASSPPPPEWTLSARPGDEAIARRLEMWTRMLFSALCDADFLDTEAFFNSTRAAARGGRPRLDGLADGLRCQLDVLEHGAPDTEVNRARRDVRGACEVAAASPPGFFSLTVPTGGGKTLASMAFALTHAVQHHLDRVVVVIPYTSIIEQSADVYRSIFGADAIVEHHSALDPVRETAANRVACENWDAPVVVTTTVQFFESLFARRPAACRKLHNLARSVVILDEAQALPGDLLPAIFDGLGELVQHYGASVVICTATQPAWRRSTRLPQGLDSVREICPPSLRLFERLRRVEVAWPASATPVSWDALATSIASEPSCLAVVHLRDDARTLCQRVDARLGTVDTVHLSALMTPAHRSAVLAAIKHQQRAGRPVRVVSTQLVEAGVDVDFPVVFRALAGLDSLAQAAGRCNREGRLTVGHLRVFAPSSEPPPGVPRTGRDVARMMLRASGGRLDLFAPEVQRDYFSQLYERTDLARGQEIQKKRAGLQFRSVADGFHLIRDDWSMPLVVAHDDGAGRLEDLRRHGPSRERLRALQRYTINLPRRMLTAWAASGAVRVVAETVHALEGPALAAYDERFGLVPDRMGDVDSSRPIVG